ncbi:MAG: glycosidase [Candidatus Hecatellales archaeon]|nr:MAG: glycosidase [Candidatus Hecatellales archaeon]
MAEPPLPRCRRPLEVFKRFSGNPILKPLRGSPWESRRVFNCAAFYERGRIHRVYWAQGEDNISRLGYASTSDGFHIEERLKHPIFQPSSSRFEMYGCEDPRLTKLNGKLYMTYTAYGRTLRWRKTSKLRLAQIGLTWISLKDFLEKRWRWGPRIYPLPYVDDKNCVLFPEKFDGKYVMYHRIPPHIWISYSASLEDWSKSFHRIVMQPQEEWEWVKIGSGAPPIKLGEGWLLIYHGVDRYFNYRLGLALISKDDPENIVKLRVPVLEPKEPYEKTRNGQGIVFTCGAVPLDGEIIVYYGGADRVVGAAKADISELLSLFEKKKLVSPAKQF